LKKVWLKADKSVNLNIPANPPSLNKYYQMPTRCCSACFAASLDQFNEAVYLCSDRHELLLVKQKL